MSRERHEWIRDLGYDVLGVTELHQTSTLIPTLRDSRFITADDAPENDEASGVGMYLSNRMADRKLAHGNHHIVLRVSIYVV